jgi:hypothetical protein
MPNTIDTYVAANYRRAFAPFTRFNTRKLAFYQISLFGLSNGTLTDEELDGANPYFEPTAEIEYQHNGYFQRAIQAVETRGEIYGVFRPGDGHNDNDGNSFIVLLAEDTANVGSTNESLNDDGNPANYNDNSTSIAETVADAIQDYVEVYQMRIRGGEFRFSDLNGLDTNDKASAKKSVAGTPRG